MAQVRFKVNVSDKLDYTPLDTIEDNISVVRGNFTTGQPSCIHSPVSKLMYCKRQTTRYVLAKVPVESIVLYGQGS